MASHILMKANLDPTITVGGILPAIHGNIRVGHSENFIAEACEYTNSFLSFFPKIELILMKLPTPSTSSPASCLKTER